MEPRGTIKHGQNDSSSLKNLVNSTPKQRSTMPTDLRLQILKSSHESINDKENLKKSKTNAGLPLIFKILPYLLSVVIGVILGILIFLLVS